MLEIRDLHVKFHTRQREAVAGVSLTIHDGRSWGWWASPAPASLSPP